jgi:hypothetical protein
MSPDNAPKITLSAAELPAAGYQSTFLTVDRFGRYSIRVENPQGSSLEVYDRMAGSIGKAGEAGGENGRVDLFLDRGQYQLWVQSADKGTGKAKIQARPFRDVRGGALVGDTTAPRLVETRLVQEKLDDLEQVSYWLEVGERRGVRLEAAGRNLADLRLWHEGTWLVGVEPSCQPIQPVTGQPLMRCRLAAILEPGLYLLAAYGGPAQPWAEGSDEHPFYLRWGEPRLPDAGRRRYTVSPFGEDHFRLPDNVNFFRVELPEARPFHVGTGWVRGGSFYEQEVYVGSGEITKESVPPAVEVRAESKPSDDTQESERPASIESSNTSSDTSSSESAESDDSGSGDESVSDDSSTDESGEEMSADESSGEEESATEEESTDESSGESEETSEETAEPAAPAIGPLPFEQMLTVSGAPGQTYVLQHFEQRDAYSFRMTGQYWVSSVHAGAAEDSIDATALVVDNPPNDEKKRFLTAAAISLDGQASWSRRFNLLEAATLFLEVKAAGRYKVTAGGLDVRTRVEPFLITRPENYQAPDFKGSSSTWDLDPGYYVLTLDPQKKGIVTLTLGPAKGGAAPLQPVQSVQSGVRFAPLTLENGHSYDAYLNHQPGVTAGWVLRPWPVDLGNPLPVSQKPGEPLKIPFHTAEAGTLRAEAEDGSKLSLSVDGGPFQTEAQVAAGDHTVEIRHDLLNTVSYSLWVEPASLQAMNPLPPLPDTALAALPKLPVLSVGSPRFVDLERGQKATFLVRADKPGLYAIQSTGLLATSGTLRTRTVPELRREAQNGVGRNFTVQQYLREGDYQVTVEALGQSKGHIGLALETTPLLDGGELRAGMPAHFSLPAGQAVAFRVAVTEQGTYTLRALGLGFKFLCRFEGGDGWPWDKPNIPADLEETLDPGTYRLVLLPQPVDARALVLLEKKSEPLTFKGHGPHALPLDKKVENVWMEPEGPEGLIENAERPPDVWRFELPAKAHTAVELTEEMQGHLTRVDATAPEIFVPPGRGWKGELEAGKYQLAAECSRRNSRVRYQVTVRTEELVPGLERQAQAPVSLPVSVGKDGLVELSSIAPADVRARLYDADGKIVAEGDDRPDDWNFLLFQRLAPGYYSLRVEPVAAKSADVRVAMRTPAEIEQGALGLPFQGNLQLGSDVLLRPLTVDPKADLLLAAARSKDSLGLSIETKEGSGWRTVGTAVDRDAHLEVPVQSGAGYRLRVWSLDRHETPVRLNVASLKSPRLSERDLKRGAALPDLKGFDLGAAVVDLDRPGVFRLADAAPGLRGSGVPGSPLTAVGSKEGGVLSAPGERFWLVRDGRGKSVKAERISIPPGLDGGAQFPVPDGSAVTADLGDAGKGLDGPVLALVTAPAGQPGVRLGETSDDRRTLAEPAATQMAIGPRTALAVALAPKHPVAQVWQAGSAGKDSQVAELRLAQLRFPEPSSETLSWGVLDGTLTGIAARQLELPNGARKLRLSLGEGTVAVLSRAGVVVSTHWQGGAPFEERLDDNAADHLTLLHLRTGADPFTVELLPRAEGEEALAVPAGAPFERSLDRAGTLRLVLPDSQGSAANTFHVRGADSEAVLLGRNGVVVRGADVPVGRGGVLLVHHGPGLLLAWLGAAGEETASLWPKGDASPKPVAVQPPASVPLAGRFADIALSGKGPRVLHLRAAEPLATLLHRPDGSPDDVEVHRESGRLDVFLPPGEARLGLRALAGAQLSGVAEITETPVVPIAEGLGPEVLLPAGGSRWFSFHVDRPGPVGVGAHADSDVVEIELYDRAGHRLEGDQKAGVVRMPELAAGDYLLALRSPAGAAPVKARPAVAGLVLPDTGPPSDVIQKYLQDAGAEAAPESVPGSEP